jgi:hypothetical protein
MTNGSKRAWLMGAGVVALVLLLGPTIYRVWGLRLNERTYRDTVAAPLIAAQPLPTATALVPAQQPPLAESALRSGPVVIDFAHFNQVNAAGLQPLAAALARRGLATRIWLSDVDPFALQSTAEIPDQSAALRMQLVDASAMVVISPFIWWHPGEIDLLESFVADGGRLLLISDPDIVGDAATYMNLLAERFGVVYNDDYLYDTTRNDENYTHFFLDEFEDVAAPLAGSTIAMYGGRSISGDVITEARSAATTRSSRRTGVRGFTTIAIGGDSGRGTTGRVLALADFDVLTEPNVVRFDNQRLVDFTADFLAAAQRTAGVADFPASLGKYTTLYIGTEGALNADTLLLGARLQRRLEETGRTLSLAGAPAAAQSIVTPIVGATLPPDDDSGNNFADRMILSDYDYANNNTRLLEDVSIALVTELVTPTVTALPDSVATIAATPTPAPAPIRTLLPDATPGTPPPFTTPPVDAQAVALQQGAPTPTTAAAFPASATPSPTPPATPTPLPTPVEVDYLVAEDGLRLVAAETVLVIQNQDGDGIQQVSVIGFDSAGISAGVDRLLKNDFSDCIVGKEVTFCPVAPKIMPAAAPATGGAAETATATPLAQSTLIAPERAPVGPAPTATMRILLVDDDAKSQAGERSEADTYLKTLTAAGYSPDLWSTAASGAPNAATLKGYTWMIWSNGGYANGNVDVANLDALFAYLGEGGRITISSRRPFFNMGTGPATALVDIVVADNVPELVAGLPTEPITLAGELGNVIPLQEAESGTGFATILTRGPASADSDNPAASAGTDANESDAVGARLVIVGFSTAWLPSEVADRFIRNMADWILSTPQE